MNSISKSFYSLNNQLKSINLIGKLCKNANFSSSSKFMDQSQNIRRKNNPHPLKLTNMPRNLATSPLELISIRINIAFTMFRYDPSFKYSSFLSGASQALLTVSNLISRGDFNSLKGLVDSDAINEIKSNYEKLDTHQKSIIGVKDLKDIQTSLATEFITKFDDHKLVGIGMKFYVAPGFAEEVNKNAFDPIAFQELAKKFKKSLMVADYR